MGKFNLIKSISKKRQKEISLLFCVDYEPRKVGSTVDQRLAGWLLHPEGQAVALFICVDGRPILPVRLSEPRLDIFSKFPAHEHSLMSGFKVLLPFHLLKKIGPGHVTLTAFFEGGQQIIWQWAGGQEDESLEGKLRALVAELNKAKSPFEFEVDKLHAASSCSESRVTIALRIGSHLSYLRSKLSWLVEQVEDLRALSDLAIACIVKKEEDILFAEAIVSEFPELLGQRIKVIAESNGLSWEAVISSMNGVNKNREALARVSPAFPSRAGQESVKYESAQFLSGDGVLKHIEVDKNEQTRGLPAIGSRSRNKLEECGLETDSELSLLSGLIVSIADDVGVVGFSIRGLVESLSSIQSGLVLMPTPFGGEGLRQITGLNHYDLYSNSSVNGRKVPALYPLRKVGPVWAAKVNFLCALESKRCVEGDIESEFPTLGLLDPPPEHFVYHCDLRNPFQLENARGPFLTKDERKDMQDVFDLYVKVADEVCSNASEFRVEGSKDLVYFLTSPRNEEWNEEGVKGGLGYCDLSLVEELLVQNCEVVIVTDDGETTSQNVAGLASVSLADLIPQLSLGKQGFVIAAHPLRVRDAFTISYLTGSPVGQVLRQDPRLTRDIAPEDTELYKWALVSEVLPIYDNSSLSEDLSSQVDGSKEAVFIPAVINREIFKYNQALQQNRSILCVLDGCILSDRAKLADTIELLRGLREQCGAFISVMVTDRALHSNEFVDKLKEEVAEVYSDLSPTIIAELMSTHQIYLDLTAPLGGNYHLYEAMACGCVPIISYPQLRYMEVGRDEVLVIDNEDYSRIVEMVSGLFSKTDELRSRTRRLSEAIISRPEYPSNLYALLNSRFQEMCERLKRERSVRNPITVIIPVYGALDALSVCVRHLARYLPRDASIDVLLVNDCSDMGTSQWMEQFVKEDKRFRLLNLERNQGFVQACIAGAKATANDRDLVLLNSDVFVTEGALSALADAAYSRFNVALASCLSTFSPNLRVELNPGDTLYGAEKKIRTLVNPTHPTVITVEGQFLYIRRYALEKFGFFDEVYGRGYCEESDLSMRVFMHGYDTVVADNSLIMHRHAASFGTEEKSRLVEQNRQIFDARWARYYAPLYGEFLARNELGKVRSIYQSLKPHLEIPKQALLPQHIDEEFVARLVSQRSTRSGLTLLNGVEVVFILPSVVLGGGTLSVLQHVDELLMRGVQARVISLQKTNVIDRPYLAPAITLSAEEIMELDFSNQKVVATFWTTAYLVKAITERYPQTRGYYYVQDYEPWFYARPTEFHSVEKAERSYELNLTQVAKTGYPKRIVEKNHGSEVHLIRPGIDLNIFYPGEQEMNRGRPRLVAMYRPETARRGTKEMLKLFAELGRRLPELKITLFGSDRKELPELEGLAESMGKLRPQEVAKLYRQSDIIVDLSYWHGFGRMGLEGMACGVVPVLSSSGGIERYAEDGRNAFVIPGSDPLLAAHRIIMLAKDREMRWRMRSEAVSTALAYSESNSVDDWLELWRGAEMREKIQVVG